MLCGPATPTSSVLSAVRRITAGQLELRDRGFPAIMKKSHVWSYTNVLNTRIRRRAWIFFRYMCYQLNCSSIWNRSLAYLLRKGPHCRSRKGEDTQHCRACGSTHIDLSETYKLLFFKTWRLHYPQCIWATEWHPGRKLSDYMQLPLEQQKASYYFFHICSHTLQKNL